MTQTPRERARFDCHLSKRLWAPTPSFYDCPCGWPYGPCLELERECNEARTDTSRLQSSYLVERRDKAL
jgi:hypothetical protein